MEVQRRITDECNEAYLKAEKEFFIADRAISHYAEGLESVLDSKQLLDQLDEEKYVHIDTIPAVRVKTSTLSLLVVCFLFNRRRRQKELDEQTARRKERTKRLEKEALDAQAKQLADYQASQAAIVKKLNKEARAKVADENNRTKALTATVKEVNDRKEKNRIEAVLELKTNVDAVRAEVATMAEKHNRKIEKAKKQLEDEKESLLAQGLNPYVEFRKKQIEEEAAAREKRMKAAVEKNKADLAAQMEKEHKFIEKQEKAKRQAEKYEKEHRASLGRHVIEERNRAYIESKTSAHTEVLDPSGKAARVDPSQITDVADFTFGLGKSARIPKESMKKITDLIRQELKVDKEDFGEYARLVSGLKKATTAEEEDHDNGDTASATKRRNDGLQRTSSAPAAAPGATVEATDLFGQEGFDEYELRQFEAMGSNIGSVPGMDATATTLNFAGDQRLKQTLTIKTTEEEGDAVADESRRVLSLDSVKYQTRDLSKFERDALDRAKDRHRDRIEYGVPQIAGGKMFQGDAFASTPSIILFKDFEVGRTYRKVFTLTNVSYTFNSFKMLDLKDDIIDFFTITFEKPGRMSAGMSCSVEIVFKPQLNKDILDEIKLLTETGPVSIPLHCLIRRCAPRIVDTHLNFGSMIVGQKNLMTVKIVNTQALSTRFTIEEVEGEGVGEDHVDFSPRPDEDGEGGDGELLPGEHGGEGVGEVVPTTGENPTTGSTKVSPRATVAPAAVPANNNGITIEVPATTQAAGGDDDSVALVATNEAELTSRVRRVMTAVLRKKRAEQDRSFVSYAKSSVQEGKETLIYDGLLDGYASTTVIVRCAPLTIGYFERRFRIRFDNVDESQETVDDLGALVRKEQTVDVRVDVLELPIYVEEETVDVKCTFYDRIYRRKLNLHNRGNIAYRVTVKVAKRYQGYVDVQPTVFFVQANAFQSMNIKFTPTTAMMRRLAHFFVPDPVYPSAGLFALPVEIQVANQDLPVFFIVKSITTPSTLEMSEDHIDFGRVYVGQKSMQQITIRNTSMLAQKIAFVRLKKELTVTPNEGFAILLPLETMVFTVSFAPASAIEYHMDLTILTSANDHYTIPIHAKGLEPPLIISHPVLQLRTTMPGQKVNESFLVTNTSPHHIAFELMPPDKRFTWLTLSPLAMSLAPQESCRVEVEYLPPREIVDQHPHDWYEATARTVQAAFFEQWNEDHSWMVGTNQFGELQWTLPPAPKPDPSATCALLPPPETTPEAPLAPQDQDDADADGLDFDFDQTQHRSSSSMMDPEARGPQPDDHLAPEEWGVNGAWNIPIFIKRLKRSVAAGGGSGGGSSNETVNTGGQSDATLQHAPAPQPSSPDRHASTTLAPTVTRIPMFVTIETEVCRPQMEADVTEMDFGQIAVATRITQSFRLYNRTSQTIHVQTRNLSALGPFTILRPIRPIRPNESASVLLECLPKQPGLVVEVLELLMTPRPAYRSASSSSAFEIDDIDDLRGGHRIYIPCRVQALLPSISIDGLSVAYPPPVPFPDDVRLFHHPYQPPSSTGHHPSHGGAPDVDSLEERARRSLLHQHKLYSVDTSAMWAPPPLPAIHPRSGVVDLGHVLVSDAATTKKLGIKNTSQFPVTITIYRSNLTGRAYTAAAQAGINASLTTRAQRELTDSTATGQPIVSIRPTRIVIPPNATEDVEVIYRPDRVPARGYHREDFELQVGQTDEVLSLGVVGRPTTRQYTVVIENSSDDLTGLYSQWLQVTAMPVVDAAQSIVVPSTVNTATPADGGGGGSGGSLRALATDAKKAVQLTPFAAPSMLLLFPDPYAVEADPSMFQIVDPANVAPAGGKGAKGGAAAAAPAVVAVESETTCRRQVKRLKLVSCKSAIAAQADAKPASFEVLLDDAAKEAGIWSFSVDKGALTPGKDESIEVVCMQPRPRHLGGVAVGAWKSFTATVVIKGGWFPPGESDEQRIPIQLQAFVSI